jgi:hypothetical protein
MNKTNIFREAISHCRWKKVLYPVLEKIKIEEYKNKNFEEVFRSISILCQSVKGIGTLTIYDISAAICRFHTIHIDKVYIIGNGPKKAIQILKLKAKTHKTLSLQYVEINDILHSFQQNSYKIDEYMKECKNGDIFESFICNWQKTQ